eukprot:506507-Hanusia_phi.AAC.2
MHLQGVKAAAKMFRCPFPLVCPVVKDIGRFVPCICPCGAFQAHGPTKARKPPLRRTTHAAP